MEVDSGDYVTIETLTHHANDDAERMIKGDPGAESVYYWDKDQEERRPPRRRADEAHALWPRGRRGLGRSHLHRASLRSRRRAGRHPGSAHPRHQAAALGESRPIAGKSFGSNAAAWWGFHYKDLLTEPRPREVITIYEIDSKGDKNWATAVYNFRGRRRPTRSAWSTRSSTIRASPSITRR